MPRRTVNQRDSSRSKVWKCEIGIAIEGELPEFADAPMREAVKKAFRELTSKEPVFIASGWDYLGAPEFLRGAGKEKVHGL